MDIRQQLRTAGVQASTLEARELVCFASGKTRQQLQRDGQLYVPPTVEEQARALVRRHLAAGCLHDRQVARKVQSAGTRRRNRGKNH